MDRRDALKKISVGAALATAGPLLLPSTRVAYAASGDGDTGLLGLPVAGAPLPFSSYPFSDNRNHWRQVSIYPDMGGVTCDDGNAPIITYQWRINSTIFGAPWWIQQLRLTEQTTYLPDPAGTQLSITPGSMTGYNGPTGYSALSYATGFLLRKTYPWGDGWIPATDVWSVECRVRWHCDGASNDVEAEYLFSGTGNSQPSVANTSWNIVSA